MTTEAAASHNRLQLFPVAFFSSVMGLAGLAMALQQGEAILGLPRGGGLVATVASLIVFALLAIMYVLKLMHFPEAVVQEWRHPVKMSFGATITGQLAVAGRRHPRTLADAVVRVVARRRGTASADDALRAERLDLQAGL